MLLVTEWKNILHPPCLTKLALPDFNLDGSVKNSSSSVTFNCEEGVNISLEEFNSIEGGKFFEQKLIDLPIS